MSDKNHHTHSGHHHDHHHGHDHGHSHAEPPEQDSRGPELEDALDPGIKSLSEALRWLFVVLKVIMILVVILFFVSGWYQVEQSEQAVVLRFGQVKGVGDEAIQKPGAHWAWPRPIEEVIKIPASSVVKQIPCDAFWYYLSEREKTGVQMLAPGETLQFSRDGYSLTGSRAAAQVMKSGGGVGISTTDYNLVHTKWNLRYKVSDATSLVENLWDGTLGAPERGSGWFAVEDFLQNLLCDAVNITSANRDINTIVWDNPQKFREEVEDCLRRKLEALHVGLSVSLELVDQVPPRQVKQFFDMAASAGIEAEKSIRTAQGQADVLRSQAQSDSTQMLSQAKAYSRRIEETAKADATYMREILDKINQKVQSKLAGGEIKPEQQQQVYQSLLAETTDQLYHEAIRDVMSKANEAFVIDSPKGTDEDLRVQINRDASLGKKQIKK